MGVFIKNGAEVKKKIELMKLAGLNSLHVVSDWDRTLTKEFVKGLKIHTSWEHIRRGGYLGEKYTKKDYELFDKYYPIEQDNEISPGVKNKKMHEWWSEHLQLLIDSGLKKEHLMDIVNKEKTHVREGFEELFELLEQNNVPLLIFSAGLGDIIKEFLKQKSSLTKNIHIISNFFKFDEKNKIIGFENEIIHSLNKKEIEVENFPYYAEVKSRRNVLLLGDVLADIGMIDDFEHDLTFKIGFLNKNVNSLLKEYLDVFDVVLTGDSSLDYVVSLLKTF